MGPAKADRSEESPKELTKGVETFGQRLKSFSGAVATRVIDRSGAAVEAHAHDWPVLSLYRLGSYTNETDVGSRFLGSPSAILYRGGAVHANRAGSHGFEQIEIEFDPKWLGASLPDAPVVHISSADLVPMALDLARAWEAGTSEEELRKLTQRLVGRIGQSVSNSPPSWILDMEEALRLEPESSIASLARTLELSTAWVGAQYKRWTGETVQQASARVRVAKAAAMLRQTSEPAASLAAGAGFYDQSHMIKTFARLLGRTPSEVRAEARFMRREGTGGTALDS